MDTKEKYEETPEEKSEETPEEEVKPDETVKVTLNKNGKPRKTLSEEDQKKRLEILKKGREAAAEKRRKLREEGKAAPSKPVAKPIPEPPLKENDVSESESVKVISLPKKKKKKKVIVMESSDSSSSEEEVIVKKKKKKKPSPPPTPPAPVTPSPPPKPVQPRYTQEEMDNFRREKIKQMREKERIEKTYNSLFN